MKATVAWPAILETVAASMSELTRYASEPLRAPRARKQYHREMARILRWSAALAAFAIPVIIIVSAITEPRQSLFFNCPNPRSACDGVLVDRAQRWGPHALLLVVVWIVVTLIVAAIIDHVGGKNDVEVS